MGLGKIFTYVILLYQKRLMWNNWVHVTYFHVIIFDLKLWLKVYPGTAALHFNVRRTHAKGLGEYHIDNI